MAELEKVIKGLECCLNTGNFEECAENCPYFTKKLGVGVCSENMMRDALSLLQALLRCKSKRNRRDSRVLRRVGLVAKCDVGRLFWEL